MGGINIAVNISGLLYNSFVRCVCGFCSEFVMKVGVHECVLSLAYGLWIWSIYEVVSRQPKCGYGHKLEFHLLLFVKNKNTIFSPHRFFLFH